MKLINPLSMSPSNDFKFGVDGYVPKFTNSVKVGSDAVATPGGGGDIYGVL